MAAAERRGVAHRSRANLAKSERAVAARIHALVLRQTADGLPFLGARRQSCTALHEHDHAGGRQHRLRCRVARVPQCSLAARRVARLGDDVESSARRLTLLLTLAVATAARGQQSLTIDGFLTGRESNHALPPS